MNETAYLVRVEWSIDGRMQACYGGIATGHGVMPCTCATPGEHQEKKDYLNWCTRTNTISWRLRPQGGKVKHRIYPTKVGANREAAKIKKHGPPYLVSVEVKELS